MVCPLASIRLIDVIHAKLLMSGVDSAFGHLRQHIEDVDFNGNFEGESQ
jgi:hypothetical protein